MESRTKDLSDEMIAAIENERGEEVEIIGFTIEEYICGDPTTDEATVSGSEIEVKAYASLDDTDDTNNKPFRVKCLVVATR